MNYFDFEMAQERPEFQAAWAMVGRANELIDSTQTAILGHAGITLPDEGFPSLEFCMRDYEAAYALTCLNNHTEPTPVSLRQAAIDHMPTSHFEDELPQAAPKLPPEAGVEAFIEIVGTQRIHLMNEAGYTGILGVHSSLQNTFLRADDAARKTGLYPSDIFLDDEFFFAMVRASTTPRAIIAGALRAIETITPEALLDESLDDQLRRTLALEAISDPEDLAVVEARFEMAKRNPVIIESCIPVASAMRHGVAQTVIDQIGTVWSPHAYQQDDSVLRQRLDAVLQRYRPLPETGATELDPSDLKQIAILSPDDFLK